MRTKKENQFVETFISQIKGKYKDIIINYEYNEELDEYDIWHNNKILQFESEDFLTFVGTLMKKILHSNDVFNFSFGYDYFKAKQLEPQYNIYKEDISYSKPIYVFNNNELAPYFSFDYNFEEDKPINTEPNLSFAYKTFIYNIRNLNFEDIFYEVGFEDNINKTVYMKNMEDGMRLAA